MTGSEEGQMRYEQWERDVDTPLGAITPGATVAPVVHMTAQQEAAAFEAFASQAGG